MPLTIEQVLAIADGRAVSDDFRDSSGNYLTTANPWRVDKYTDRHSGIVTAVEVVPVADSRSHISDESCPCIPTLSTGLTALILVHNAFDGREAGEANNTEVGN